ncbi:MAG TPA: metallophosphoesterase [Candidatus Nanoarchaeia archaeon]|nr:metallophosphoesterase [Candidatus Nanoarchaeia archaeon]
MKILAFSDIHGKKSALIKIKNKTMKENPNLLICAGDLSFFSQKLKILINYLDNLNKPLLIIHGNHESIESIEKYKSKNIIPIHNKIFLIDNYIFFGYGGGGFTKIDKKLEKEIEKYKLEFKNKKLIIITHAPPYNTKLDLILNHIGNKSIRNIILKYKPILAISGHIHENETQEDYIQKTKCINPGMYGKIIKI